MKKSDFKCPICGDNFFIVPQKDKGVLLRCDNITTCIPHENVFGYGVNEKAAADIAKQKYARQANADK